MLQELRLLYLIWPETRKQIDAATYITDSALKAIEGKLSALGDNVCKELETGKAGTASLVVVGEIAQDVKEIKKETNLLGTDLLSFSYPSLSTPHSPRGDRDFNSNHATC